MSNAITRRLEAIHRHADLGRQDVAHVLGAGADLVARWSDGQAFPQPDIQSRLLNLDYITDQLSDFYEPADVRRWLFAPQPLLDDAVPAVLIQNGETARVIGVIDQLRDGVFI